MAICCGAINSAALLLASANDKHPRGSCFASSGAVHPSLTIIANTLRVGDHLLGRLI